MHDATFLRFIDYENLAGVGWKRKGKFTDGTLFDSSFESETPFEFKLGNCQVFKDSDQGLLGMCVGEKHKLNIPAKMGYGERSSSPKILGGVTIIFDIELIIVNGKGTVGGGDNKNEL